MAFLDKREVNYLKKLASNYPLHNAQICLKFYLPRLKSTLTTKFTLVSWLQLAATNTRFQKLVIAEAETHITIFILFPFERNVVSSNVHTANK